MTQLISKHPDFHDDVQGITFSLRDLSTLAMWNNASLKVKVGRSIVYSSSKHEPNVLSESEAPSMIDKLVNASLSQESGETLDKSDMSGPSFSVEFQGESVIHFKKGKGFHILDKEALSSLIADVHSKDQGIEYQAEALREAQQETTVQAVMEETPPEVIAQEDEAIAQEDELPTVQAVMEETPPEAIAQEDEAIAQEDELPTVQAVMEETPPEAIAQEDEVIAQEDEAIAQEDELPTVQAVMEETPPEAMQDSKEVLLTAVDSFLVQYGQQGALESYITQKKEELNLPPSEAVRDFYTFSDSAIQNFLDRADSLGVELDNDVQARLETLQDDAQAVLRFADHVTQERGNVEFPTMEEAHPEAITQPGEPHLDAASVGLMQFADVLPEPHREWLVDKVEGFKKSGVAQAVMEHGVPAAKAAINKTKSLGADVRERAVADSIVAVLDEFGAGDDFEIQAIETEKYLFAYTTGATYEVVDRTTEQTIAEFSYDKLSGPTFTSNDLSIADQFEVIKAGTVITKDRAKEGAQKGWAIAKDVAARAKSDSLIVKDFGQSAFQQAQQLGEKLGNLAPAGTKQAVQQFKAKKVDDIAQALTSSKTAVKQAGKSVFEGANLTFARTVSEVGEQVQISTREGKALFNRTTQRVSGGIKTSIESGLSKSGMQGLFQQAKSLQLGVGRQGQSTKKTTKEKQEVGR